MYAKLGDFEASWEAGQVAGWADRGQGSSGEDSSAAIDVAAFASVEELETLGKDPFSLPPSCMSKRTPSPLVGISTVGVLPSMVGRSLLQGSAQV